MTHLLGSTLVFLLIAAPASAQLGAPQGDFRVDDRPGTVELFQKLLRWQKPL